MDAGIWRWPGHFAITGLEVTRFPGCAVTSPIGRRAITNGGSMTPSELIDKLEELRAIVADKIADLEEQPKWGTSDEREAIINAIDDADVQLEALREALEQPDDHDHDNQEKDD